MGQLQLRDPDLRLLCRPGALPVRPLLVSGGGGTVLLCLADHAVPRAAPCPPLPPPALVPAGRRVCGVPRVEHRAVPLAAHQLVLSPAHPRLGTGRGRADLPGFGQADGIERPAARAAAGGWTFRDSPVRAAHHKVHGIPRLGGALPGARHGGHHPRRQRRDDASGGKPDTG